MIGSVSDVDSGCAAYVSDECGQGSTAIQVVTALAPHASKLANYVRGQTWLSPPFAMSLFAELLGREPSAPENESRLPGEFAAKITLTFHSTAALRPEELERFKKDAEFFKNLRYTLEAAMNVITTD